eukprot:5685154-Lingulodinium_polyedra.AAC.1
MVIRVVCPLFIARCSLLVAFIMHGGCTVYCSVPIAQLAFFFNARRSFLLPFAADRPEGSGALT